MSGVGFEGFEEFQNTLRRMDFGVQRRALIQVARAGGQVLLEEMRRQAPHRTGDMARGLTMRLAGKESDIHEATVDVGNSRRQFYALFVNDGTKARVRKSNKGNTGAVGANPFRERAIAAARGAMAAVMKAKMWDIIRKSARNT